MSKVYQLYIPKSEHGTLEIFEHRQPHSLAYDYTHNRVELVPKADYDKAIYALKQIHNHSLDLAIDEYAYQRNTWQTVQDAIDNIEKTLKELGELEENKNESKN